MLICYYGNVLLGGVLLWQRVAMLTIFEYISPSIYLDM